MSLETWLIYFAATVALSLTPGPNGLLALTHGALYGVRKTLFTVLGGVLGFVLIIALSMFGIGALLGASAGLLTAMKWIGGAYLVWLGIQVWRSPAPSVDIQQSSHSRSGISLFRQGLLSAVVNPKVLLFFAAFLPQFIDPGRSLVVQFVVMALTFAIVELLTEILIASLAQRVRNWLRRSGRKFNQSCGGLFMLIGAWLPLSR